MVFKYEWSGFKYAVSAQTVGEECEKIEARDGAVTQESLVDSARSEGSAIHGLFEWDDRIAGEKWRLNQARVILSNLKVTVLDSGGQEPQKVRAYLNPNPIDARASYFNVQQSMQDLDLRSGVLARAEKELRCFTEKYRTLTELCTIFDSIEEYFDKKGE